MSACREHHFYPWGRCEICQMQIRYYTECLTTLNSWSEKEKQEERKYWEEQVNSIKFCKPHQHEKGVE